MMSPYVLFTSFAFFVSLSQWEFQVGPAEGVRASDDLWMARYLLHRLSEEFGVAVSFHPKIIPGDVGACGGHVNFSTKPMREDGGIQ